MHGGLDDEQLIAETEADAPAECGQRYPDDQCRIGGDSQAQSGERRSAEDVRPDEGGAHRPLSLEKGRCSRLRTRSGQPARCSSEMMVRPSVPVPPVSRMGGVIEEAPICVRTGVIDRHPGHIGVGAQCRDRTM
jgi:hypothetical protein